jgi:hypothetical protein
MASQYARFEEASAATPLEQKAGSVLELATRVLAEHGVGRLGPSMMSSDVRRAPQVSGLIKQLDAFREQTQDVVDALTRALEQLPAMAVAPRVTDPVRHSAAKPEQGSAPLVSLLRATTQHGQAATTRLGLINDNADSGVAEVVLHATSLVNERGFEIPSSHVSFAPNPVGVTGAQQQPVYITVRVPEKTPTGTYSGLVQAAGLPEAAALLVVDVEPAGGAK